MNDKVMSGGAGGGGGGSSKKADVDIEDLNNLERELNSLGNPDSDIAPANLGDLGGGGGGGGSGGESSNIFTRAVSFGEDTFSKLTGGSGGSGDDVSLLGKASAADAGGADSTTWDGFGKFNNIPMNPDKVVASNSATPPMSKEDLLREKFKYLRKLEALETKGVSLTKKYNMDSPLMEMQGEYEMIMEEKSKTNSIKFQGNMLMAVINGIEFLNGRFDPFDVKLDGWSEQVNENLNDYDDVFGELHEKYKSKATLAPELKLMFQLAGSAMMVHMTNTMFKSSMPGMDDILRQNPDLMRQFQTAAVNSMTDKSPNFAGFMGNMMGGGGGGGGAGAGGMGLGGGLDGFGPPPPPMATQGPGAPPPPANRGGNNPFGSSILQPPMSMSMGRSSSMYPSTSNSNDLSNVPPPISNRRGTVGASSGAPSSRPEMKGPSDISDILSGLKTRTIDIQRAPPGAAASNPNESSTISLSEMKEMGFGGDNELPKRSKRRPRSDKNIVSLDL